MKFIWKLCVAGGILHMMTSAHGLMGFSHSPPGWATPPPHTRVRARRWTSTGRVERFVRQIMGSDFQLYHFLYDSQISYENVLCLCFLLFKWTSHLNVVGFGRNWSFLVPHSVSGTGKVALKCQCPPSHLLFLLSRADPRPQTDTITWFFLPLDINLSCTVHSSH